LLEKFLRHHAFIWAFRHILYGNTTKRWMALTGRQFCETPLKDISLLPRTGLICPEQS
jgi:hypothetical protein